MSVELSPVDTGFVHKLMRMDIPRLQLGLLCVGILIYGAWGSPTPDHVGAVELVVAVLLIVGVGLSGFLHAFVVSSGAPGWRSAARILLVFGLSVPLAGGVWLGHDTGLMIRDIAAFGFMMLAAFLWPLLRACLRWRRCVCGRLLRRSSARAPVCLFSAWFAFWP